MMNRRDSLKHLAIVMGVTIAPATIISVFNSCKTTKTTKTFDFLSKEEQLIVNQLLLFLFPSTIFSETIVLEMPFFIDQMLYHTEINQSKNQFNIGSQVFCKEFQSSFKHSVFKGKYNEFETIFLKYFSNTSSNNIKLNKNKDIAIFLTKSRQLAVFGYGTSKLFSELS